MAENQTPKVPEQDFEAIVAAALKVDPKGISGTATKKAEQDEAADTEG